MKVSNSKALLTAEPSLIAYIASLGLFRLKLVCGDPWRCIVEISPREKIKVSGDWVTQLILYDDK